MKKELLEPWLQIITYYLRVVLGYSFIPTTLSAVCVAVVLPDNDALFRILLITAVFLGCCFFLTMPTKGEGDRIREIKRRKRREVTDV